MKHLVISDPHTAPGDNLDRFRAAGNLIVELQPDVVVCLGDFSTLDSCSFYMDKGERPTLYEDRLAFKDASNALWGPLFRYNEHRQEMKKRQYNPDKHFLAGNHEYRMNRQCDENSMLSDLIGKDPNAWLGINHYWDHVYPYREYVVIDGVQYVHNATAATGKAIAGVNRGRRIALESAHSTVYGHHHTLDLRSVPLLGNKNGSRIALNAPAFMEQDNVEDWAKLNQTGWHYGLLIIDSIARRDEPFGFEWIRTDRLIQEYL